MNLSHGFRVQFEESPYNAATEWRDSDSGFFRRTAIADMMAGKVDLTLECLVSQTRLIPRILRAHPMNIPDSTINIQ